MSRVVIKAAKLGVLSLSILFAMVSGAEARSCSELTQDLRAMQKAQASLLQSMIRKNESMASTLDQYAQTLGTKKNLRKSDTLGMRKSATAFRNHQEREEKLVRRFENKTDELISQVEECLKSKTIAAQ